MSQNKIDRIEFEIREGNTDNAIWAKSMALSNGDEEKAKQKYLTLRLQQLEESDTNTDNDTYSAKIPDGYISIAQYSKNHSLTYEDIINRIHLNQLNAVDIFGEWYINNKQHLQSESINNNKKSSNYFLKHFYGKLPLWQSFWINTVVVSLIAAYLVIILSAQIKFTLHPSLAFVFVVMWTILILLGPWQFIGLWRSAQNHMKTSKKSFTAITVFLLVILGSINYLNTTFTVLVPQIKEFTKIGLGKDDIPKYTISILRNGEELEIYGGIKFGLTKEVKKYFQKYPNIKVIHLNSTGGRIAEAQKLSKYLEKKKLITYTSTGCYSACVDIYMAGAIRLINKNAYLGFHQPSFPGMNDKEIQYVIDSNRAYYLSRGVSKSFLDKAYAIKSSDIWKPSHYELKEAGLITQVTNGVNLSATEFRRWNNSIKLESTLLKIPIYQTIKTYYPKEFDQIIHIVHTSIKNGDSKNEMYAKTRKIISSIYLKALPYSSDNSLLKAMKNMIYMHKELQRKNIADCYSLMMEDGRIFDLNKYYTKTMRDKELHIMNDVISSQDHSIRIPTEKEVEKDLTTVYLKLYSKYGDTVNILDNLSAKNINKRNACKITIAMYEEIFQLPKDKSIRVLRYMMGNI